MRWIEVDDGGSGHAGGVKEEDAGWERDGQKRGEFGVSIALVSIPGGQGGTYV